MFDMTFLLLKKCIEKNICLEHNSKKKQSKPIGAKAENIDWPCWGMVWAFPLVIYMSAAYLKKQIKNFAKIFHLT